MARVKIVVEAKSRPTSFCPVSAQVAMPAKELTGLALVDESRSVAAPFQVQDCGRASVIHWILDSIAARQKKNYALTDAQQPAAGPTAELSSQQGDKIQVKIGGEVFTNYHFGSNLPRPVLYPVLAPYGQGVTRPFPMEIVENDHLDHKHHRSIWVAWGDVNGSDNWSEEEGAGRVLHKCFHVNSSGPVFACIAAQNDWVDVKGKKLMEDRLALRFYNLPDSMRLMDMDVTFHASEGDVRFGDTKEGGICAIRVAASMAGDRGGKIENAFGGTNEDETWGKRASWCDYSGVVGGHTVGIAVFDHPSSFRYPTYWHVRNYGLMTANPFGLSHFLAPEKVDGSYVLKAGEELRFRYRIYLHAGDVTEGGVKSRYLDWLYPPQACVVE